MALQIINAGPNGAASPEDVAEQIRKAIEDAFASLETFPTAHAELGLPDREK